MFDITIEEVAMLPVPIRVKWQDGTSEIFNLPRLGTEDFIPWLNEETKRRRQADQAALAKVTLNPRERMAAEKAAMLDEAIIADLAPRVRQPDGVKKVIFASMAKGGIPPEKQEKLWSVLPVYVRVNLAALLSTFFAVVEAEAAPASNAPNQGGLNKGDPFAAAGEPATPASDSATTGSPIVSSSAS